MRSAATRFWDGCTLPGGAWCGWSTTFGRRRAARPHCPAMIPMARGKAWRRRMRRRTSPPVPGEDEEPMSHPRVLVVEPSASLRKLIRDALEGEGYVVLDTPDGAAALAERDQFGPDVIVQELVLPDMPGLELTRQLRLAPGGEAVPVPAGSGFLGGAPAGRGRAAGAAPCRLN